MYSPLHALSPEEVTGAGISKSVTIVLRLRRKYYVEKTKCTFLA